MIYRASKYIVPIINHLFNRHEPCKKSDIFVFSTPRSGSTWLTELISTQPGFTYCNEPFDIRNPFPRLFFGASTFREAYELEYDYVEKYLKKISEGNVRLFSTPPWKDFYTQRSKRIVFKIIHFCENYTDRIQRSFGGYRLLLVRHPIAVSLSRKEYPRIGALLETKYSEGLKEREIKLSKDIFKSGSKLEKGVVSWCIQNKYMISSFDEDEVITYEQMVSDPIPIVNFLQKEMDLDEDELMLERLSIPSGSTRKSDYDTQKFIEKNKSNKRDFLAKKWKKQITDKKEDRLMNILKVFNIDVYDYGNFWPHKKYRK